MPTVTAIGRASRRPLNSVCVVFILLCGIELVRVSVVLRPGGCLLCQDQGNICGVKTRRVCVCVCIAMEEVDGL